MTADAVVRSFLALEIPDAVRTAISELQRSVRRRVPEARWVRPENVHLTVKFLGERPRSSVDRLRKALVPAVAGTGAVDVALRGGGFFSSPARPRVAWIGGTASGIEPVVETVESVASGLGWKPERRGWSPHLTVARMRRPWPRTAVERFLEAACALSVAPFTCSELVLFRSTLGPGGARYDVESRMSLT